MTKCHAEYQISFETAAYVCSVVDIEATFIKYVSFHFPNNIQRGNEYSFPLEPHFFSFHRYNMHRFKEGLFHALKRGEMVRTPKGIKAMVHFFTYLSPLLFFFQHYNDQLLRLNV